MASYSRGRDPLFDSNTQVALEKRSKELMGMALIGIAVLCALMFGSYTADDPSWITATDAPVQNWLGRPGAAIAAPLMMTMGRAMWVLPFLLAVWGLRYVLHFGEDRALSRVIFAPLALITTSLYCATLAPGADWPTNFGLGGLFGDTVLGVVLTILPVGTIFGVKLLSFVMGLGTIAVLMAATGFIREEIRTGARFVFVGFVMLYALFLKALGRGASVTAQGAKGVAGTWSARRAEVRANKAALAEAYAAEEATVFTRSKDLKTRAAAVVRAAPVMPTAEQARAMPPQPTMPDVEPPLFAAPAKPDTKAETGFLSGLLKRKAPTPEFIHTPAQEEETDAPDPARVSARISDAIKSRAGGIVAPDLRAVRMEPILTSGRGPTPLVLPTETGLPASSEEAKKRAATLLDELVMADEPDSAVVLDDSVVDTPAAMPVYRRSTVSEEGAPLVANPLFETETPTTKKVVQHPPKRASKQSSRAKAEAQPTLPLEDKYANYEFPPLSLLTNPIEVQRHHLSDEALEENARMLENVLDDYGVKGEIVSVRPGPVVTMYELEPAPGLKASRVIGLADDIARSMSALSARCSTVPGRTVIGIELPNENREKVVLREILSHRDFGDGNQKLPLALGKDIGGEPIVANLAKMPHLLIAGTTGSGKSVAINTMILSLLYKLSPEECRMIMIDPKMLELSVYDGIPHLLSPVVTDPKKAVVALKWVVGEMEERYRKMSKMGVRNIDGYNGRVADALEKGENFDRTVQTGFDEETGDPIFETEEITPEKMPYIVVIVDEMADLMMVAGKEIEACIQRLAQMARASGIHLIMATQRPSVDVITGTIKANFPTRISFQVTSKIDSRTILGEMGAEQLLGMGDMLYMAGGSKITRVHGPFCSDEEVEEIVNHLKSFGPPEYMSGVVDGPAEGTESNIDAVLGLGGNTDGEDALYDQAVGIVIRDRKCSTSYIQRKLAIGYNKAARLVEQMEDQGVVSAANHVGKREILVPEQ